MRCCVRLRVSENKPLAGPGLAGWLAEDRAVAPRREGLPVGPAAKTPP